MSSDGSESFGADGDLLANLLPALVQTFVIVLMGYVSARAGWMPREVTAGLGRFAASYSLPALCFLSIAQLDLGLANPWFLVGMLIAKGSVALVVGLLTAYLTPEDSELETRSWSLAALFAMCATSSNDFALGLPIVQALFTGEGGSVDGFSYLFLMAPITLLEINPVCFSILELAAVLARRRHAAAENPDQAVDGINCLFIVKQVLLPTIANPVVFCVGMGVLANISGAGARLPVYVSGVLDTIGDSFASLALFCLGASMFVSTEPEEESGAEEQLQGEARDALFTTAVDLSRNRRESIQSQSAEASLKSPLQTRHAIMASQLAPANDYYAEITAARWIQAGLLVCAKSLLLPVVARFVVLQLTGSEQLSRFAFVYSTFPSSAQNLLFAERYGASESDCSLIALSTLIGTILFGPLVFASAEMITIDLRTADADAATNILLLVEQVGWASVVGSLWTLFVVSSMILSPHRHGPGWRRHHLVWSVFFLAACQAAYPLLSAVCSDVGFRDRYPAQAKQCTLGIEGMVAASRIWGVIIIVSDIHRLHKEAATTSVLWKVVRVGKWGILWVAWLLPSLWVGLLWGSGLWARLDLTCWACFNSRDQSSAMSVADRNYALSSSALASCLALVAIAGLLWEQRQRRRPTNQSDDGAQVPKLLGGDASSAVGVGGGAAADLEAPLLSGELSPSSDPSLPMWSSVLLRTVGLCNLLGLLLQIAVGIGALLPALDGIMLEIIALNHFGLFVQGIATGLLLGGLSEAPAVRAVTRFAGGCGRLWTKCMGWYVDPRRPKAS